MRTFSANDYLMLWEQGERLHSIDRALLVLRQALPEADHGALARLPVGRRDRSLLEIRQANFGDHVDAHAVCSDCGERVEFALSCQALIAQTEAPASPPECITIDGAVFRVRCPNSLDLAEAAASADATKAEDTLLACCVDQASPAPLTPARRAAIAEALSALDPAAEILINLTCPFCSGNFRTLYDINRALWLEICARALRLLQEVDTLARVYHWSETDILSIGETRRSLYLEMALS